MIFSQTVLADWHLLRRARYEPGTQDSFDKACKRAAGIKHQALELDNCNIHMYYSILTELADILFMIQRSQRHSSAKTIDHFEANDRE